MNSYQLLSELYRLLGSLDPDTVHEARRIAHSPELDPILSALAKATGRRVSKNRRHLPRLDKEERPTNEQDDLVAKFSNEIKIFDTRPVQDLARFLEQEGITISFRKGDGRARIKSRAQRAFKKLSKSKQQRLLKLLEEPIDSETAGWLDVIRNR